MMKLCDELSWKYFKKQQETKEWQTLVIEKFITPLITQLPPPPIEIKVEKYEETFKEIQEMPFEELEKNQKEIEEYNNMLDGFRDHMTKQMAMAIDNEIMEQCFSKEKVEDETYVTTIPTKEANQTCEVDEETGYVSIEEVICAERIMLNQEESGKDKISLVEELRAIRKEIETLKKSLKTDRNDKLFIQTEDPFSEEEREMMDDTFHQINKKENETGRNKKENDLIKAYDEAMKEV